VESSHRVNANKNRPGTSPAQSVAFGRNALYYL